MAILKYMERPAYETVANLSSKGQIIISAKARHEFIPKGTKQFEQVVFSDGTIVLKPKAKYNKRAAFQEKTAAYFEEFGAVAMDDDEDKAWDEMGTAGGESID